MPAKREKQSFFFMRLITYLALLFLLLLGLFIAANQIYLFFYARSLVLTPMKPSNLKACQPPTPIHDTVRILIIDGGGIVGIMPLMVLRYLEEQTGRPTSALFDVFSGTSTGSIIVSSLNTPNKYGNPKYSANQIISQYVSFSKTVMFSSVYRKILTLNGLLGPNFPIEPLYSEFVKEIGKNLIFHDLIKNVSIISYNLSNAQLEVFKSWDCEQPQRYFPVPDLLLAATATPSFYSPVIFKHPNGGSATYVDGMVFANNPSIYALREAFKLYPDAKKYIIVHLGDGVFQSEKLKGRNTEKWGFLQWALPIASIIYKSRGEDIRAAILCIKSITPKGKVEDFYFNLNIYFDPFDTSEKNIKDIEDSTNHLISQQKDKLDYLAKILSGEKLLHE